MPRLLEYYLKSYLIIAVLILVPRRILLIVIVFYLRLLLLRGLRIGIRLISWCEVRRVVLVKRWHFRIFLLRLILWFLLLLGDDRLRLIVLLLLLLRVIIILILRLTPRRLWLLYKLTVCL